MHAAPAIPHETYLVSVIFQLVCPQTCCGTTCCHRHLSIGLGATVGQSARSKVVASPGSFASIGVSRQALLIPDGYLRVAWEPILAASHSDSHQRQHCSHDGPCPAREAAGRCPAGHLPEPASNRLTVPDTEEATGSIPVPPTKFYQVRRLVRPSAVTCRLEVADYFSRWKRSLVQSQHRCGSTGQNAEPPDLRGIGRGTIGRDSGAR
jgi:hypothetical protein